MTVCCVKSGTAKQLADKGAQAAEAEILLKFEELMQKEKVGHTDAETCL